MQLHLLQYSYNNNLIADFLLLGNRRAIIKVIDCYLFTNFTKKQTTIALQTNEDENIIQ